VLTAHPTEAKRRTTLGHLLRLAARFDDPDEILETLWHTRETRERPMDPLEEVDRALFLVERTILSAVADFYQAFDRELSRAGPGRAPADPFEPGEICRSRRRRVRGTAWDTRSSHSRTARSCGRCTGGGRSSRRSSTPTSTR
jgi:hypothetical protein